MWSPSQELLLDTYFLISVVDRDQFSRGQGFEQEDQTNSGGSRIERVVGICLLDGSESNFGGMWN